MPKITVPKTEFARDLRAARAEAGYTQQQMAEAMSIPKRTIQDWERSIGAPPPYVQRLILNELREHAARQKENA